MSRKPMHPATLAATLAMVGPGKNWPTKTRIVLAVGAFEGGAWLTASEVAAVVGISAPRARKLLKELTEARVLLRDGGGGGRVFWTEVNPDPTSWRWVPWVHDRHQLAKELGHHLDLARRGPLKRFIARPMWKRCEVAKRLLLEERSGPVKPPTSLPNEGSDDEPVDDNDEASSLPVDVRSDGRSSTSIVPDGAMPATKLPKKLLFAESADEGVVVDSSPGTTTPTSIGQPEGFAQAKAVLMARALNGPQGRKYVSRAKEAHLAELLRDHGRQAVLDTLRAIPADMVPGMLDAAAAALTVLDDPIATATQAADRIDTVTELLKIDDLDDDYRAKLAEELRSLLDVTPGCDTGAAAASGGPGL